MIGKSRCSQHCQQFQTPFCLRECELSRRLVLFYNLFTFVGANPQYNFHISFGNLILDVSCFSAK